MRKNNKAVEQASVVVCDIDGTIAKVGERRAAMLLQERPDWNAFYKDAFDDEPIENVCGLVRHMAKSHRIVFCTSRRASVRRKTQHWLREHLDVASFPHGYDLLMRGNGDERPDTQVKPDLLRRRRMAPDSVLCIFEDSRDMVRAWTEEGYTCIKVA